MRQRKPEDALEEYLNDRTIPDDPDLASLARTADRLERDLDVETPDAYRERALFAHGIVAAKTRFRWSRLIAPMIAVAILVASIAISREANPGDALYGFRNTLNRVGLAEDPAQSARRVLAAAEEDVLRAEAMLEEENPRPARQAALDALILLRDASTLLQDGSGPAQEMGMQRLEDLRERARAVMEGAVEELRRRAERRAEDRRGNRAGEGDR